MASPSGVLDERARSALRRLEWQLHSRRVTTPLVGEHRSIFRGRGMEFDQVVKYAFGDDIRDVEWNVTARLGDVYRKVFQEDREVTVFVVLSDDPALQFGSGTTTKRDVLLQLAGLTMMLSIVNRERAGLLHATPGGTRLYPPTRRRAAIMGTLASLFSSPAPDPAPREPFDFSPALRQPIPRGALLVWLGEVPDHAPPPEWALIRRRHQVVGIRVEDEWERRGPALKDFLAYDPAVHQLVWVEDSPAARVAHAEWLKRRERLWSAWWPDPRDRLVVDAEADPLASLSQFLRARSHSTTRPAGRRS